ncbi:MAG: fibrillarin-like rRNA/tRNA 2'-O-methyltransferase [Nanoarchaeota archaeon]|nr:fibrillarin-like rRNA/tRNA 2'-O-methyltransferase [Nanoarchaeota archaeon]
MQNSRFQGVYEIPKRKGKVIFTENLTPGKIVYGESLVSESNIEYREWIPSRSKLSAAIHNGIREIGIKKGDVVLYLGAASGTTVSHVSDIVKKEGFIFALDFAPRVMRDLVFVCEERKNIAPLMADANRPETFMQYVSEVDVIYQDVAQKNQLEIFLKNVDMFLKKGGHGLLAIKARSIDVTKKPRDIFREVKNELEASKKVEIIDAKELEPFTRDHVFFVVKKR